MQVSLSGCRVWPTLSVVIPVDECNRARQVADLVKVAVESEPGVHQRGDERLSAVGVAKGVWLVVHRSVHGWAIAVGRCLDVFVPVADDLHGRAIMGPGLD